MVYYLITLFSILVFFSLIYFFFFFFFNIDIWGNREFRTLWNSRLIIEDGYQFGREGETISSALGKNKLMGTLTKEGNKLANILDKIDTNHCIKSMKYFDDAEKEKFEMLKSA